MHARIAHRGARRRVAPLLTATLALILLAQPALADIKLDRLQVGPELYRNVTVTGSNGTDVFLTHSKGMANLKVRNLNPETRWRLGLGPKPGSPEALAEAAAAARASSKSSGFLARWFGSSNKDSAPDPLAAPAPQPKQVHTWPASFKVNPTQPAEEWLTATARSGPGLLLILAVILLTYGFACFCLQLTLRKAGYRTGFGLWIPILNYLHALRAARMSEAWLGVPLVMIIVGKVAFAGALVNPSESSGRLLGYLLLVGFGGLIALVGQVIWCVRIVGARGKTYWLSLLMILALLCPLAAPLALISEQLFRVCWISANALGAFAFLYLAFSSAEDAANDDSSHEKIVISPVFSEA